MYPRPAPKSKWCVYAVTVHVCAVKRLHTTNLGLKINNFVTQTFPEFSSLESPLNYVVSFRILKTEILMILFSFSLTWDPMGVKIS